MTGKALKDILVGYNISQSEIARQLGISQQSFNQMLSSADVKTSLLERIAVILNSPISNFYADINDATATNHSIAISGHNNHAVLGDTAVLEERVKSLEALLAEKERLIKVYEKMMDK